MAYEVKNLPPEIQEPEKDKKDAADGQPLGVRLVAGTVGSALALAALPHGVACVEPDSLVSLLCKPQQSMRHEPHIEQSTSTASASFYAVAIVDMSSGSGVTVRPPFAEIGLTTYAPEIRIRSTDPSSGAVLGSSTLKSV